MTSTRFAKILNIHVTRLPSGALMAKSPDLKGFRAVGNSTDELFKTIPEAVAEMYRACGVDVVVTPAESPSASDPDRPWIAVPVEVARRALANA